MELPQNLLAALRDVRSVGAITGAGLSAESGIPTYRGTGGLYDDPDEGDSGDEEPEEGGEIEGMVRLATDEAGEPTVTIPACPDGSERSLEDFVPVATANTLVDEDGEAIVRTGEVDDDGEFEIDYLDPDTYTLGYLSEIGLEGYRLVFEASVEPGEAALTADADVEGVVYTISAARCEPDPAVP